MFNRKWKAEIAIDVYKAGGGWKEYCARIREEPDHRPEPTHALELIEKIDGEIIKLSPTCQQITAYAKHLYNTKDYYGVVTVTNGNNYFHRIHDTWYSYSKNGGRVHINLGCNGYHLMLTKETAPDFVGFIKSGRSILP